MPYVSNAQRRFFHTPTARRAGITPAMTEEWDEASRDSKLPEKTSPLQDAILGRHKKKKKGQ